MNNDRRKRIRNALNLIEQARDILDECAQEEQEYFDNMPEPLQGGERGEKAGEDANTLSDAHDEADALAGNLSDLLGE